MPAGRCPAQPRGSQLLGLVGSRSDARVGVAGLPAAGIQAHHGPGRGAGGQPGPDRPGLHAPTPGQRLVGDITYLRTGEGWLYLATVIDLATRMVVGWQLADHMRTSLVTDALKMAITHGHVQPGAIFHSDKGAQTI